MSVFEPPRVNVAVDERRKLSRIQMLAAVAVPFVATLLAIYFVTPVLSAGAAAALEDGTDAHLDLLLSADLVFDMLFVGAGAYWALEMSRAPRLLASFLFALSLVAVRVVESGGLPGVINTGFPVWYDVLGNLNDFVAALAAAAVHGINNPDTHHSGADSKGT